MNAWVKGLLAGAISGSANGVLTGLAACGIAPDRFDFHTHSHNIFALTGIAAGFGAIIGIFCYLKQSPLP